jgi:hypothetical protein
MLVLKTSLAQFQYGAFHLPRHDKIVYVKRSFDLFSFFPRIGLCRKTADEYEEQLSASSHLAHNVNGILLVFKELFLFVRIRQS